MTHTFEQKEKRMKCEGRLYAPRKEDVVFCCENCEHHDPERETMCDQYEDEEEEGEAGETFVENLRVYDEWESGGERFRLVNHGAGPDELQVRGMGVDDKGWRPETSCYVHGVLCARIRRLAAKNGDEG